MPYPATRPWLSSLILLATAPGMARAEPADAPAEPSSWLFRIGASLGGGYTSNVFDNASGLADLVGLGGLSLDLDLLPSDAVILRASYHAEGELYRTETHERHYGQLLNAVLGIRSSDTIYLSLEGGAENALYPRREAYTFWGVFGRAGLRWEIGETSTLEAGYALRSDTFPEYDLDNTEHDADLGWETAIGDDVEVSVPLRYTSTHYRERYLLGEDGEPTARRGSGQRWRLEPEISYLPSFDLRLSVGLLGDYNDSDDTYYAEGPFGVEDPAVDPTLVQHYDSYRAGALALALRWELGSNLVADLGAQGGMRRYGERPAFDAGGLDTGQTQSDTWIRPRVELRWYPHGAFSVTLRYHYNRQWSNDALWDYEAHGVRLLLDLWWES